MYVFSPGYYSTLGAAKVYKDFGCSREKNTSSTYIREYLTNGSFYIVLLQKETVLVVVELSYKYDHFETVLCVQN